MTAKFKRERERGGRRVGRVSAHTRQHVATNGQRPRERIIPRFGKQELQHNLAVDRHRH